ncbi:helix-turn-helix transcriptional regulator [Caenimonas sedimenti]|uniref:Helix-turn-helix transcriptional regulator n=2 Tax=Caenimonas sedimenti TaxID=2596921 RepID=A0A562ZHC3_9BURK|nr:helix-turn-helix transcriptional regulator [Caenimonas sedimenti]TWO67801.1 helix-turn-helix transcriptional regulator [Caenimonas sedimenti]
MPYPATGFADCCSYRSLTHVTEYPNSGYSAPPGRVAAVPRVLQSTFYKKLRSALAEARSQAGLTQEDVAEKLGRPQSFVSKYESGERRLDVLEFVEVCQALGVLPTELLSGILA